MSLFASRLPALRFVAIAGAMQLGLVFGSNVLVDSCRFLARQC